jgi:phosphatidylcholine synthase
VVWLAWLAHLYTALGASVALAATLAVFSARFRYAFVCLALAMFIDATDGLLARALKVKERLPFFDGALLDNIIDYLTYVFIPVILITRANLLPEGGWEFLIGSAVMMASAYGFSRTDAKIETTEHFFTGFPSYWNVVALYMYLFRLEQDVNAAVLLILSAAVFVTLRFVYPSRTRTLRTLTITLGFAWAVLTAWMIWRLPETGGPWAAISLVFPIYYVLLSFWLDWKARQHENTKKRESTKGT